MYETFYGFNEKPFTLLPDPEFLFLSKKHRMALTMLEYGVVNQAGFSVITGEVGAGKTTLIRKLLHNLDHDITIGLVSNSQCETFEELLQWILFAYELEYTGKSKVELYQEFTSFLIQVYGKNRRAVLIIDEAQHLSANILEQLRMLSNVNADKHQVLQLILVGQPELRSILKRPELQQFAQRIAIDYHLLPLDLEETHKYICHRLTVAGGDAEIINDEGRELVWRYSRGVPRLINVLCDTALVYGFAEQESKISVKLLEDVIRDKQMSLSPIMQVSSEGKQNLNTIDRLFGR